MRSVLAIVALMAAGSTLACTNEATNGEATNGEATNGGDLIASAVSAAPVSITENATIKDNEGNVLREGSNGFTCYPQAPTIGPMCNDAQWDALLPALTAKEPFDNSKFGVSYMLAGEGEAIGVSNSDPYASEPTADNDWIKEGPHMMLIVPDDAMLEGLSSDPNDPVYVMWKGTPYQHVMIRIAEEE